MSDRTGLSRGDRNRSVRLARMRQLLPLQNAIVGIDLADSKQAAVEPTMTRGFWLAGR